MVITVKEAAEMLHCSRTRIFQLLADGVLIRAQKYGRSTVILRDSVIAALEMPTPTPPKKRRRTPKASFLAGLASLESRMRDRRDDKVSKAV